MSENPRRLAYLQAMGITPWQPRSGGADAMIEASSPQTCPSAPVIPVSAMDWSRLADVVSSCTDCELHRSRSRTVFGTGARDADWMIIGEAPGAEEDRRGEPFVGRAGSLLDAMLKALDLGREQVYIANVLKCRPPGNQDPLSAQIERCSGYLRRQIELVQPGIILAVGRISAHHLLDTSLSIGRLRGQVHRYGDHEIPLVVTYHPAYLLRRPDQKYKSWEDLKLARRALTAGSS